MKKLLSLFILGTLIISAQPTGYAAPAGSDWPSLNYDAAQSNYNPVEKTLTPQNILKLHARKWTIPVPSSVSYPIVTGGRVYVPVVSNGRVHVRAYDAASGKPVATYPKDALGGMLMINGNLYLAGHVVQVVDPANGNKLAQINPLPGTSGGTFIDPVGDRKVLVVGYASRNRKIPTRLYGIDRQANHVLWSSPSIIAQGTMSTGRIMTETTAGSEFYDESSGKPLVHQSTVHSDWFAGSVLAYTVASVKQGASATLYAYDGTGQKVWQRVVGPFMVTRGWAHAVGPDAIYVQAFKPRVGVEALDPESGQVLWSRPILNMQRMVLANGMLFVLTYGLGEPVRLLVLNATSGSLIGNKAIVLSAGYYAFPEQNGLMVADGMVFLRVVGPDGPQLVVLGL